MNKKMVNQMICFLMQSSPTHRYKQYRKIFQFPPKDPIKTMSDGEYLHKILNNLEIFDNFVPFSTSKPSNYQSQIAYRRVFNPSPLIKFRLHRTKSKQFPDQIEQFSKSSKKFTQYEQMQQMITLLPLSKAKEAKKNIITFYKYLLVQRTKLDIGGLQHISNHQLCEKIISALYAINQNQSDPLLKKDIEASQKKLIVMNKLSRARQYLKIGQYEFAKTQYEQIYKDDNASEKSKNQALKFLCQQSKKHNNLIYLEQLMSQIRQNGAQEHKLQVLQVITKIKAEMDTQNNDR